MITRIDCETWSKNKLVNPLTGRKINPKAKNGVYAKKKFSKLFEEVIN